MIGLGGFFLWVVWGFCVGFVCCGLVVVVVVLCLWGWVWVCVVWFVRFVFEFFFVLVCLDTLSGAFVVNF
ncbi:hypothetical protein, partial [Pseudomonas syringae group genomosp. 7]|uniref:hypothetical protein n=1 Tax=Pseudomonas syringae group genomosp. 7 TaxID=251699 RepID=UPI00376FA1B9